MSDLNEQLRGEFEAWARSNGYNLWTDDAGRYRYPAARGAWEGFEAARRAPAAAPAPVAASDDLAVVARLYTQNGYRRAATSPGPGQALVLKSDADRAIARAALAAVPAAAHTGQPVGEIVLNGVIGVKFHESCDYGTALPVGTKLYAAPTTATADAKDAALRIIDAHLAQYNESALGHEEAAAFNELESVRADIAAIATSADEVKS